MDAEAGGYLKRLAELAGADRLDEALAVSVDAVADCPNDERILRAHAVLLRRLGHPSEADGFLSDVLAVFPDAAWAHAQLGLTACFARQFIPLGSGALMGWGGVVGLPDGRTGRLSSGATRLG